jgi:hypothetical protein
MLNATGAGHFVGTNLSIEQREDSWWGEGDDQIFVDGATTPTLSGTGSEDYYGGAWCYSNEFSYPYIGMPLRGRILPDGKLDRCWRDLKREDAGQWNWPVAWRKGDLWNVYRYHIPDPIPFKKSIKVQIEHGWINNERQDNYSIVAYWYQTEPHTSQPELPKVDDRLPQFARLSERALGFFEGEDFVDYAIRGSDCKLTEVDQSIWGDLWSRRGSLEWEPDTAVKQMSLPVPVSRVTTGGLTLALGRTRSSGIFSVSLDDKILTRGLDLYDHVLLPHPETFTFDVDPLTTGIHMVEFTWTGKNKASEGARLAIDRILLYK